MTTLAAVTEERRRSVVLPGAAAVALSSGLNAAGVFSEEEIHWLNLLVGLGIALAGALVVFGWFALRALRRPERAWRTGLACSLLALLLLPAFWSCLPPVFGVAGVWLGLVAFRAAGSTRPRRLAAAAAVAGAAALVLDIALYAGDIASRV